MRPETVLCKWRIAHANKHKHARTLYEAANWSVSGHFGAVKWKYLNRSQVHFRCSSPTCAHCALFIYLRVLHSPSLSLSVCTYNMITHLIITCRACHISQREEAAILHVCVCVYLHVCSRVEGANSAWRGLLYLYSPPLSPSRTRTRTHSHTHIPIHMWSVLAACCAYLFAFSLRQTLDSYAHLRNQKREPCTVYRVPRVHNNNTITQ